MNWLSGRQMVHQFLHHLRAADMGTAATKAATAKNATIIIGACALESVTV